MHCVLSFLLLTSSLVDLGQSSESSKWVSFWFGADGTYPQVIDAVAAHKNAITSVIVDCGMYVDINTTLVVPSNPNCKPAVEGLTNLGVKAELAVGLVGNNISAMRNAFQRGSKFFSKQLLAVVDEYNIQGINFDWEPQGTDAGDLADATAYASFLSDIKNDLSGKARLTICVADWSPVLSQYGLLAPAVDRLLDMETYNDKDYVTWRGYYKNIVKDSVPKNKVGIGMYPFALNGSWAATPGSVTMRMSDITEDGVAEVFVFRFLFQGAVVWPFPMWWQPLADFLSTEQLII